jgi:inhibitor of Bruton tyrosine kinase
METLLESGMLDLLSPDLVADLGAFVRRKQAVKSPYVTSNKFVEQALKKHEDWLALQDIPEPVMKSGRILSQQPRRSSGPIAAGPSCDDVFVMDELNAEPNRPEIPEDRASTGLGWKHIQNTPRSAYALFRASFCLPTCICSIDMKVIMAEAQGSRSHASRTTGLTPPHRGTRLLGVAIPADAGATSAARPIPGAKPTREEKEKSSSYESAGLSSALSKASHSPWRILGTESEITPPTATPMSELYGTVSRQEKQSDYSWRSLKTAVQSPSSHTSKIQSLPLHRPPSQPSLGPIFAPSRQAPAGAIPSSARRIP